jgi:hypothetical protein
LYEKPNDIKSVCNLTYSFIIQPLPTGRQAFRAGLLRLFLTHGFHPRLLNFSHFVASFKVFNFLYASLSSFSACWFLYLIGFLAKGDTKNKYIFVFLSTS